MNTHFELDRTIRIAVIRHLIEKGRAPEPRELAAAYDCTEEQIDHALIRLHDHHGLVLHPHSVAGQAGGRRIWLAHPFSTAPTHFFVERAGARSAGAAPAAGDSRARKEFAGEGGGLTSGGGVTSGGGATSGESATPGWWANCAKCALGVAAILEEDANIHTRLGAEAEPITVEIRDGRPTRGDLVMHVALPVAQWWENVCYTCSTILFFRDEQQVSAWCAAHGINHGAVLPIEQAWELARQWYGNSLAPDWRRKTATEAASLFESLGLRGEFWRIPETWK